MYVIIIMIIDSSGWNYILVTSMISGEFYMKNLLNKRRQSPTNESKVWDLVVTKVCYELLWLSANILCANS